MYYNAEIREYTAADIPHMKRMWIDVFGDDAALVDRFFELLPSMGTALCAVCEHELQGAAYLLNSELWENAKFSKKLVYVYAVAVEPEARGFGIGSKLVRACRRFCWENNFDICCTLPAEDSLYGWYHKIAGFSTASCCKYEEINAGEELSGITELYADEYGFKRSELLRGKNYVNYYYGWLLYAEALAKTFGGGFFAYKGSVAYGYVEDGVLLIKEAINDPPEFMPALCARLGVNKALVRRISDQGNHYIASCDCREFPPDTLFTITLD